MVCLKCGKPGHFARECYQKSTFKSHSGSSTIRCYDCNAQVVDLNSHRLNECTNSRKSKSQLGSVYNNNNNNNNNNPTLISTTISTNSGIPTQISVSVPVSTTTTTTGVSNSIVKHVNKDFYLLFDVSGSMAGAPLTNLKQCATNIVDKLNDLDRMSIISFDTKAFFKLKPRPVEEIKRKGELPGILSRIFAEGGTALYDAIWLCVDEIRDKSIQSNIVVLTDGEDNSSKHTYDQVIKLLENYPNLSLNIIQINGSQPIPQFKELCDKFKGSFRMTTTTEIVVTFELVFQILITK